ncbi:MAG: hypothetical protein KGL37_05830 [Acidobacteriota bacterium]|nr:hypothetical protein [Acidobacteriota bacterium]
MTDKRPSNQVASDAGNVLRNPSSSKKDKELAASILANREPKVPAIRAQQLRTLVRALEARNAAKK